MHFLHKKKIYVKIILVLFSYIFFIMNKIKIWSFLYVLISFFNTATSYAAVWQNELDASKQNVSIISNFFTTELLLNIVFALVTIVFTFFLSKLASSKLAWYLEWTWDWESNREELIWVVTRTTNISILAIGFSITLSILWVDMWIFLWGLWFWIWFTLKIFLSNFIAWIIMVTQGTYHNWDIIEVWGKMWKIRRIQALFTSVEQFDWVIYYVPNVKFLEENVSNFNSNDKRRIDIEVWVDYETDIIKAKKIMMQVIEQFPTVLKAPEPVVVLDKLDNSSINLILRFWINSSSGEYFVTRSNVTETINLAFRQAWITIPFPQITLSNRNDFTIKN